MQEEHPALGRADFDEHLGFTVRDPFDPTSELIDALNRPQQPGKTIHDDVDEAWNILAGCGAADLHQCRKCDTEVFRVFSEVPAGLQDVNQGTRLPFAT